MVDSKERLLQEISSLLETLNSNDACSVDTLTSFQSKITSLVDSWKDYYAQLAVTEAQNNDQEITESFQKEYMELVTSAFADELDDLRHGRIKDTGSGKRKKKQQVSEEDLLQQQNLKFPDSDHMNQSCILKENDLKVLAHCLESSMKIWTEEEKRLFIQELEMLRNMETDNEVRTESLHEQGRKKLFGI